MGTKDKTAHMIRGWRVFDRSPSYYAMWRGELGIGCVSEISPPPTEARVIDAEVCLLSLVQAPCVSHTPSRLEAQSGLTRQYR